MLTHIFSASLHHPTSHPLSVHVVYLVAPEGLLGSPRVAEVQEDGGVKGQAWPPAGLGGGVRSQARASRRRRPLRKHAADVMC